MSPVDLIESGSAARLEHVRGSPLDAFPQRRLVNSIGGIPPLTPHDPLMTGVWSSAHLAGLLIPI
eukprot:843538-Pyramimonas_sp.AAC.1